MTSTMTDEAAPASPTPRRNRGARRAELLQIASRVFASKGIASATVRDIAQEARITNQSGSLYHHFTSKRRWSARSSAPGRPPGSRPRPTDRHRRRPGQRPATPASSMPCAGQRSFKPDVARIFRNDAQYIRETPALADSEQRRQASRLLWVELVEAGIADGTFRAEGRRRRGRPGDVGRDPLLDPLVPAARRPGTRTGRQRAGRPVRRRSVQPHPDGQRPGTRQTPPHDDTRTNQLTPRPLAAAPAGGP